MKSERLVICIGALVALVLDVVVSSNISFFSATPNFMISYSIVISMICKTDSAYVVAFCLGLLCDLLGYGPVGLLAFLLVVAAFAARRVVTRYGTGSFASGLLMILFFILMLEVSHALIMLAFGGGVDPVEAVVYIAIPGSIFDCLLSLVIYPVMIRLLVPKRTFLGTEPPVSRKF